MPKYLQDPYLEILQERTGTNLMGIFLHNSKNIKNLGYKYFDGDWDKIAEATQQWKKQNFVTVDGRGYDKLFIVRGDMQVATEALGNLDDDASYARIKNAFVKGSNNQKTSRVIATQMVEIIAQ